MTHQGSKHLNQSEQTQTKRGKTAVSRPKTNEPIQRHTRSNIQKPDLGKAIYGNFTDTPNLNAPLSPKPTNVTPASPNIVQRVIQIWSTGTSASAFDRRDELINRMNGLTSGMVYSFNEETRAIEYEITDEGAMTPFDRRMRGFIDQEAVVPMRLINAQGYVGGGPLMIDSLQLGYVDLDDLMASDDLGFQSLMMHFLTERFNVRDYDRRVGMTSVAGEWARVHPMGVRAETELMRDVFNDPSIHHNWVSETSSRLVSAFRSRDERYHIFLTVGNGGREIRGATIVVRTADGRRLSVDEFLAERAGNTPPAPTEPTTEPTNK